MNTQCKKCGYERQPTDTQREIECPKCGAIYAKVEQHLARQKQEMEKKKSKKSVQKIIGEILFRQYEKFHLKSKSVSTDTFKKDRDDIQQTLNNKATETSELALEKNFTAMARQSLKGHWGKAALATVLYYVMPGAILLMLFGVAILVAKIPGMQYILPVFFGLGIFATLAVMNIGFCKFTLLLSRKDQATLSDIFCAFNFKKFCDGFMAVFLIFLYILIPLLILIAPIYYYMGTNLFWLQYYMFTGAPWYYYILSILFDTIGIVIILPYIMTFFVFADYEDKDVGASDALRISKDIMQGNKLEMLFLLLKFVPWYLVCIFIEYVMARLGFGLPFFNFLVSLCLTPYILVSIAHYYDVIWARRAVP